MRLRWALWIALLLSVGVNLGVLLTLRRPPQAAPPPPAPKFEPIESRAEWERHAPTPSPDMSPREAPRRIDPPRPINAPRPSEEPKPIEEPKPMDDRQPVSDRPALDEGPQNQPLDQRAPRFDRVADELRLQPEQRRPFLELQRRHFEQVRAHRAQLEEVRGRLAQAFLSGDADRSKVEGLLEESNRRQNELDALLAQMLLESQKILTPEQQRRFAFLVLQRARGGGPGGPAGPRQGEYGRRDGGRPEPPFRRRPLGGRPPNG